ncbi:recombination regulator RecX [bacterium]|nr:recombination regulator RecX [bacterium]MBU1983026.1 recombination regulator RecX [bacterium]
MTERTGPQRSRKTATALQYAVKLLSARPYSEKKLRDKLTGREYEPAEIEHALRRLREEKLLDDRRYAEDFVKTRLALRPRAAAILARELRQRGIASNLAKKVAEELAPRESDEELARELIRRKLSAYASLDPVTRHRRLASLLARRGFSYDTIRTVMRERSGENESED